MENLEAVETILRDIQTKIWEYRFKKDNIRIEDIRVYPEFVKDSNVSYIAAEFVYPESDRQVTMTLFIFHNQGTYEISGYNTRYCKSLKEDIKEYLSLLGYERA